MTSNRNGASSASGDRSSALALHAPVIDARPAAAQHATSAARVGNRRTTTTSATYLPSSVVRTEARRAAREQRASGPPRARRALAEPFLAAPTAALRSAALRATLNISSFSGRLPAIAAHALAAHAAARTQCGFTHTRIKDVATRVRRSQQGRAI